MIESNYPPMTDGMFISSDSLVPMQGMRIIPTDHLIVSKEVERECNRSWLERLFSWPWQPWVKTKTVTVLEQYPDPNLWVVGTSVYCHPARLWDVYEALGVRIDTPPPVPDSDLPFIYS